MTSWRYSESLPWSRRHKLSNCVAFGELASRIAESAACGKPATEFLESRWAWRRPVFTLSCAPDLVDLFHNGQRGYRAQYNACEKRGEAANAKILALLTPKLIAAWLKWERRPYDEAWLRQSLDPAGAKIWIHQGRWSLGWDRREITVELCVDSWLAHAHSPHKEIRRKVKLGALCPREDKLVVKGFFLDAFGVSQTPKSLTERATQIHRYGFT